MGVRFLLDEDTEASLADTLSRAGHDVDRVVNVDTLGTGAKDPEVLQYAARTNRIIVTHDDDYVQAPRDDHEDVFYAPEQRLSSHKLYRIIQCVLESYPDRDAIQPVVFLTTDWL
ncbi:DUF5615 family PIN-like protein [Halobacterium noricense]|uniref:DUF5615 family PIN-like protein n=1 Tax=Halobacterium noricense TaxID=223182 RepID=UPI001E56210B|nr:DUF5615 family PIN-like protein [Halobacterium noricense]UHH26029.1 DUF5615 family PIN-like protein [Halobacterium noricense]